MELLARTQYKDYTIYTYKIESARIYATLGKRQYTYIDSEHTFHSIGPNYPIFSFMCDIKSYIDKIVYKYELKEKELESRKRSPIVGQQLTLF